MSRPIRAALVLSLLLALPLLLGAKDPFKNFDVVKVKQGPNVLEDLKTAFLTATPGSIIQLPKGNIDVDEELSLSVDHVVIRGKGMEKSSLNFAGQVSGGQGILITGNYVVIEGLSVIDTPGDGIRAQGTRGITFRDVKVQWTGPPSAENGAYGIYPVLCEDVLVENMVVDGASDAGIYVGQSQNIIVRNNKVINSVAGIEIENSNNADVFKNTLKGNTGGVLVFNLPGLTVFGSGTRVFKNKIVSNNTPNFGSGIVAAVPKGTGIIVLANDDVEIFKNKIKGNGTNAISIATYNVVDADTGDEDFDPYTESIYVHDNKYKDNGNDPDGLPNELAFIVVSTFGVPTPTIFNAKDVDPDKLVEGTLPPELEICIDEANENPTFGELNLAELVAGGTTPVVSTELGDHDCVLERRDKVVIPDFPAPPSEVTATACMGGTDQAFQANCPKLSDFGLFADNDPREPIAGGVEYDLTSPLFSDYASKYRAVFLPDGAVVPYDADNVLDLPVGTILSKTFAFARDLGDPGRGEDLIETRLLIHREGGWVGLPYIWNTAKTEAFLSVIGGTQEVAFTLADGSDVETLYRIPNANQCDRCHFDGPIGPKVRLLNRDLDYAGGTENQIDHWASIGILSGAPDPGLAPRIPFPLDDLDGSPEERARGYLETNCAHCHNEDGTARNTGLYLDYARTVDEVFGICKTPVAAGSDATGGREFDIVPGDSDASIVVYRMDSVDPNVAMPELAKTLVHEEGVALVADWIDSLPGDCL